VRVRNFPRSRVRGPDHLFCAGVAAWSAVPWDLRTQFRNRTIVLNVWRNQTRIAWKFLSAQNPQSTGSGIQMTALETLDSDDMSVLRGLVIDHVHRKYRMSQTPGFPEEIKDLYRADAVNLTRKYRKLGGRLSFGELCPSSMREARGLSGLWLQDALLK
jgi:hypothetical protein